MNPLSRKIVHTVATLAPRYLPFADVANERLPLSRLLRLSLFQISVGMALVLLVGTLNRVMIVELAVPATLVAGMISLPLVFAPFRALIGFRSDNYRSALGWRRVPYIWKGTLLQFGGFAIMPFALLVLSGYQQAADAPPWIGLSSAALAFLLVGAGAHMVQTVGLALATDLTTPKDQPKVVGLMYVMLLIGMGLSAIVFGALLEDYTPGKLIRVVQGAAVATVILNIIAIWKQEARDRQRATATPRDDDFLSAWRAFVSLENGSRRLYTIALGTMGFGMADVLLEPFGGQILGLSVANTTKLTAAFACGGLIGFAVASRVLSRAYEPMRLAALGLLVGLPAFAIIMASAPLSTAVLMVIGTIILGFGGGLFGHGTLTATMRAAPREHIGLALGAWGAVQATSAGIAIALAGVMRDLLVISDFGGSASPYLAVFALEVIFLCAALLAITPLVIRAAAPTPQETSL